MAEFSQILAKLLDARLKTLDAVEAESAMNAIITG